MQTFMDAAELCQTPQYIKLCCEHVLQHWRSDEVRGVLVPQYQYRVT